MDYERRLARFRALMDEAGVDLAFIARGANLFYLTGIRRRLEHGTDSAAFWNWTTGAFIGRQGGLVVTSQALGGAFYQAEAAGKPWIDTVRLVQEGESSTDVIRKVLAEFPGPIRSVSLDESTWAEMTLTLHEMLPQAAFSVAHNLVGRMRLIKELEEIEAIRTAAHTADLVFERVRPMLKVGVSSLEIAQEVDYQFRLAGADYTSFETGIRIVGTSGPQWDGIPRSNQYQTLQPGDSMTFDMGCNINGYSSDFGRSVYVGEPPEEFLRAYDAVLECRRQTVAAMKSGQIRARELTALARQVIADHGFPPFAHPLGHGIGVDCHEPLFLDSAEDRLLQRNMTFALEPSVKIAGKYINRTEDVVLVTDSGGEILNNATVELTVIH